MTTDSPQQPTRAGPAEGDAGWVRVARSGQVPEGYVRRFFADGVELAVARLDGSVYATSNYCTHLDCLLSSGKLVDDGIRCSCHGSVFDLQSGEPIYPPATVPIKTFLVRESGAEIFVAITAADREHSGRRRNFRASDTQAPRRAP
ncbi:MAG TPA: non-heme iron oxygenase ferredoxin subunit [Trebonia sp.]